MAATAWNDEEDEALQGLPATTQAIYLRGLRRYMNYETGVVGRPPHEISLFSLAKVVGVSAEYMQNNRIGQFSKRQARTALSQMQRVGLLVKRRGVRRGNLETLVFFLPLATTDKTAQMSSVTVASQSRHGSSVTGKGSNNGESGGSNDTVASREEGSSSVTYPVSVKNKEKGKTSVNKSVDKFSIDEFEFEPTEETQKRCLQEKCPDIDRDRIQRFISHHKIKKTNCTKDDWQEYFFQWMLGAKDINKKTAIQHHQKEDWELVPRLNTHLDAWAEKHGYPVRQRIENNKLQSHHSYRQKLWLCVKERQQINSGDSNG